MSDNFRKQYDIIIVGAGPSGLACSIYASRFKLNQLIIGKVPGGTITEAASVENYPGFQSISGPDLAQKLLEHAQSYEPDFKIAAVEDIKQMENGFEVIDEHGNVYTSRVIFLGLGTRVKRLNVPGEEEFIGRGVSYCSLCDAHFYSGKTVVIVGGGNAAVTAAIHLDSLASQVYLIYRGDQLSAEPVWKERLGDTERVEIIYNTNVVEILGDETVTGVRLDNNYEGQDVLDTDGIMIEIGVIPAVEVAKDLGLEMVEDTNFIKIKSNGATNVEGVFAGGDVATATGGREPCQLVTAVSEGAQGAISAFRYIKELREDDENES